MKLTKDASVYAQDGKEIGRLSRFVLHPRTKDVTHIVIERGLLNREEFLVPMQMIRQVNEQGIHLGDMAFDQASTLEKFQEKEYVVTDEAGLLNQGYVSDEMINRYYYYPSTQFGASGMLRPGDMYVTSPSTTPSTSSQAGIPVSGDAGSPPVQKQTEQNIPPDMIALKEGAKVISSDDKHVGDIEKVLVDPNSSKATHLLITKGMLTRERRAIPVDWVDNLNEDEVRLSMSEAFITHLPEHRD